MKFPKVLTHWIPVWMILLLSQSFSYMKKALKAQGRSNDTPCARPLEFYPWYRMTRPACCCWIHKERKDKLSYKNARKLRLSEGSKMNFITKATWFWRGKLFLISIPFRKHTLTNFNLHMLHFYKNYLGSNFKKNS